MLFIIILSEKVKAKTRINLKNISTVKVLDLANNGLNDCIADDISLILSSNELEEVYLGGNNLKEAGMIKIANVLIRNNTLKVFSFSNSLIQGKMSSKIAAALANKVKLEKLFLNENELQAEDIIIITTNLHSISLMFLENFIKSTAASGIAKVLLLTAQLEELYLGGNILQAEGISKISLNLVNTRTLRVFDISNNDISSEAAASIGRVIRNQIQLMLSRNNLQHGLVAIIKECHQTLKTLDIANNKASITVINKVAIFLCFHTKLKKLIFRW